MARSIIQEKRYDVVISGAGNIGLACALGLRRQMGPHAQLMICSPPELSADSSTKASFENKTPFSSALPVHQRASALTKETRDFLESLGIWSKLAPYVQPVKAIDITDSTLEEAYRPVALSFKSDKSEEREALAYIVYNADLRRCLFEACQEEGISYSPCACEALDLSPDELHLFLSDQRQIRTRLLVVAEGQKTSLRSRLQVETKTYAYQQSALITTIAHERPHQGRAVQHFLPSGPCARLPLRDGAETSPLSSLVWTLSSHEAEQVLSLSEREIEAKIQHIMGNILGYIRLYEQISLYPLKAHLAGQLAGDRWILLGDAAHMIHPLAGQGLNFGLHGVSLLLSLLRESQGLGLDIGETSVLEAYQRKIRSDAIFLSGAMTGINSLFSRSSAVLRLERGIGLRFIDRSPLLKNMLVRYAGGQRGRTGGQKGGLHL